MTNLIYLYVIFQLKHFLADYPLQNKYMLGKFKRGIDGVLPLFTHAGVHAIFTYNITYWFTFNLSLAIALGIIDFIVHSIIDKTKTLFTYNIDNPKFWWILGLDQMLHHLTHLMFIIIILSKL